MKGCDLELKADRLDFCEISLDVDAYVDDCTISLEVITDEDEDKLPPVDPPPPFEQDVGSCGYTGWSADGRANCIVTNGGRM